MSPRAPHDVLTITWVGHATFLIQIGGRNILTDPVWSRRASPVRWVGPARISPLPLRLAELPPIDRVLLSHDHYDHLDDGTVRGLRRLQGDAPRWHTPLGYEAWFRARRVTNVAEADWWKSTEDEGLRVTAVPAQHWTRRGLGPSDRLWCGWAIEAGGHRVLFGGDSGYCPAFREIGQRLGPFDAALLPIGAYAPRWFMRAAHMNPEEAVRSYQDLGASGLFIGMHWGTFRLTDEDPLEPPVRTRAAWEAVALPPHQLWIPRHGETRVVDSLA